MLASPLAGFILWAIASVLTYHALAGIKHLIMDAGVGRQCAAVLSARGLSLRWRWPLRWHGGSNMVTSVTVLVAQGFLIG